VCRLEVDLLLDILIAHGTIKISNWYLKSKLKNLGQYLSMPIKFILLWTNLHSRPNL
jgi:hypothetical protein